jgi:hypothetical protein
LNAAAGWIKDKRIGIIHTKANYNDDWEYCTFLPLKWYHNRIVKNQSHFAVPLGSHPKNTYLGHPIFSTFFISPN